MPQEQQKTSKNAPKRSARRKGRYAAQLFSTRKNTMRKLEKHIAAQPNDQQAPIALSRIKALAPGSKVHVRGRTTGKHQPA